MTGSPHEALHRIFQEDTSLFTRTLHRVLGVQMPIPHAVSVISPDLTDTRPMERRADTVLLAESEFRNQIVVVESQTDPEEQKRRRWPYYVSYLHDKHECDVTLLVVCSKEKTAKWARGPFTIGPPGNPCQVTRPFVLGPDNVPIINDLGHASQDVVFTVFSALTHSRSPQAAAILNVLAAALDTIDTDSAGFLAEFTEIGLGETAARSAWRTLMSAQSYRYQSEYACQLRSEAKAELRAEVEAEVKAEGKAELVLRVLKRRGIHVPSSTRDQILSCTETTTLERWFDRALDARSIEDVFN
ncbi:hypothetical protein ACFQ07_01185 [Actinomadura adrarensis]|uniref:Rpn family recombination-promoting nuclease/putative transposase n=1 Tax=Actinomadura adrarensis TaxID=1819600 RepID=A0ABW3C8S0_9ACTN